jgi:inorganic pyrophosphatase
VTDYELNCVVEIPKGSRNKYEYDPDIGAIKLDRFISASVVYPPGPGPPAPFAPFAFATPAAR